MRYFEKNRRIIMSNEVGSRLKEIRQRLKMTQAQLGEKLGINGSAVAKHESGICFPTGKMLDILATQYNVSMDYLLCGRGTLFHENKDNSNSNRLKNIIKYKVPGKNNTWDRQMKILMNENLIGCAHFC